MLNVRKLFCFVVLVAVFGGSTFAANVTLTWNPSADPTVADYNIYYLVAHSTYWVAHSTHINKVSAGQATSVTISNLLGGVTYDFSATTVDTFGVESPR